MNNEEPKKTIKKKKGGRPKKQNPGPIPKNMLQSYVWATAKYDLSVYEKRIMLRIIEAAQMYLKKIKIKDNLKPLGPILCPTACGMDITVPVSSILNGEKDENYTKARLAFKSLAQKGIEYIDGKTWHYTAIIEHPNLKVSGQATFHVYQDIWNAILDFSLGFRKIELMTAMRFSSSYSMRFYELMAGQKTPIYYPLEGEGGLREIFKLQNEYKQAGDFKRWVIDPAKKELDKRSPVTFQANTVKQGRKIVGWMFIPEHRPEMRDPKLVLQEQISKVSAVFQIDGRIYDYLKHNLQIPPRSISSNKETILNAQKIIPIPEFLDFLSRLKDGKRYADNPIGYVINAIKIKTGEVAAKQKRESEAQEVGGDFTSGQEGDAANDLPELTPEEAAAIVEESKTNWA